MRRGEGAQGEEAREREEGIELGGGETRVRGGRGRDRGAAGAEPGELVGEEIGVFRDQVAEVGERIHGRRGERNAGSIEVRSDRRSVSIPFVRASLSLCLAAGRKCGKET